MNTKSLKKQATLPKKAGLTLILSGLVMIGATIFSLPSAILYFLASMCFIIAGFVAFLTPGDSSGSIKNESAENPVFTAEMWGSFFQNSSRVSDTNFSFTTQLAYLFQLIKPSSPIKKQLEQACIFLAEIMPSKILCVFEINHNQILFLAGARSGNKNTGIGIPAQDQLLESIQTRVAFSIIEKCCKPSSNWTEELFFSDSTSEKSGVIFPGHIFGRPLLALVCLETEKREICDHEIITLQYAAVSMAIMLDNYNIVKNCQSTSHNHEERFINESIINKYLPETVPAIRGWEIAMKRRNTNSENSDFHCFLNISSDKTIILTGKSSGRDTDASLFFIKLKAIAQCLAEIYQSPADLLNQLSAKVSNDDANELFASLAVVLLKAKDREVKMAVAGQNIPLIYRQRNGFAEVCSAQPGVPVGLFSQDISPYNDHSIQLLPGDGILIYTDGMLELNDAGGQTVKLEEIKVMLENIPETDAEGILTNLSQGLYPAEIDGQTKEECTMIYAKTE